MYVETTPPPLRAGALYLREKNRKSRFRPKLGGHFIGYTFIGYSLDILFLCALYARLACDACRPNIEISNLLRFASAQLSKVYLNILSSLSPSPLFSRFSHERCAYHSGRTIALQALMMMQCCHWHFDNSVNVIPTPWR